MLLDRLLSIDRYRFVFHDNTNQVNLKMTYLDYRNDKWSLFTRIEWKRGYSYFTNLFITDKKNEITAVSLKTNYEIKFGETEKNNFWCKELILDVQGQYVIWMK